MTDSGWTKDQLNTMVENFVRNLQNVCPICGSTVKVTSETKRFYLIRCPKCNLDRLYQPTDENKLEVGKAWTRQEAERIAAEFNLSGITFAMGKYLPTTERWELWVSCLSTPLKFGRHTLTMAGFGGSEARSEITVELRSYLKDLASPEGKQKIKF
jgi:DNA-directed RNA polymerase subunit RPC12/RpoP